ncbi:hypothetical protein TIFTF001_035745 [Ficus carica]|uniref:Uncharacterized protein n=1 Tax=Ficus carica TaxID=3494 RepID=A0AA88E5E2_FICCA|nr:hypothetical protein TIFTF001_035745 [Ficus carica]
MPLELAPQSSSLTSSARILSLGLRSCPRTQPETHPKKGRETYGLGGETKERRIVQQIEDTPSPPPVRKTIGVIYGGSIYSGETVTAVKSHRRRAMQPIAAILPDDPVEHSITFHSSETTNLSRPHDDALVLTLNVSSCEVGRILVDNRSSADVLFLSTLIEMELSESDIERSTTILTEERPLIATRGEEIERTNRARRIAT